MKTDLSAAELLFSRACNYIETAGLSNEIKWQRDLHFDNFSESDLLREHAWVALCSGFKESIVRQIFDHVSLCFCDWESSESIVSSGDVCWLTAAGSFSNRAKLRGIFSTAQLLHAIGFNKFKRSTLIDPIHQLQSLPYIGPITSWHLAKNLGLNVAKPDRHLVRISEFLGFRDAHHLCHELALSTGEQANVIDLIVWRYIADNPDKLAAEFP